MAADLTPPTATGLVTFYDGARVLGAAAISNGRATLAVTGLLPGSHALSAYYGGDATRAPAPSSVTPLLVTGLRQALFHPPLTQPVSTSPQGSPVVERAAVGDVNNDGHLDVVLAVTTQVGHNQVWVLYGQGTGALSSPVLLGVWRVDGAGRGCGADVRG